MPDPKRYAEVAVAGPMRRTFTYDHPDSVGELTPGQRLLVPFGKTRAVGFYLGPTEPPTGFSTKSIVRPLDIHSYFTDELFSFCMWLAEYYFANPADCLQSALPPSMKLHRGTRYIWGEGKLGLLPERLRSRAKPGKAVSKEALALLRSEGRSAWRHLLAENVLVEQWPGAEKTETATYNRYRVNRKADLSELTDGGSWTPFTGTKRRSELNDLGWSDHFIKKAVEMGLLETVETPRATGILDFVTARPEVATAEPTDEQRDAIDAVLAGAGSFNTFLVHGITGSGKTLVYCHLCREIIKGGMTALVLTPEIALAGTTLAYFRGFFGDDVTVIHSGMTARERMESYVGIRDGKYKIVVGPRSALFAPLDNIGLIVVDEEHDSSYKQDDPSPRFHCRDAAIMRAKRNDIPIVLGSASPSIESYHHALTGRYKLIELHRRPGKSRLPVIHIVDMKRERLKGDMYYVSWPLKKKTDDSLAKKQQVIFYLNRRGHSPQLRCFTCGHVPECPNCQVKLTWHKVGRKLSCHYCGYLITDYSSCSNCKSTELDYSGVGTQKVEEQLPRLFPDARVARLDSDSATGRKRAHQILTDFAERKNDILLGTQMVSKGLDFPGVSLVGVLSADSHLDLPDFRAAEKTFARLLQVSGRSGRGEEIGEVLIQTFQPENPVIEDAAAQHYRSFYDREIELRKAAVYPPFCRVVRIILSSTREGILATTASALQQALQKRVTAAKIEAHILGPAPCPMYYLRKQYRRHLFIKTMQPVKLARMLTEWEASDGRFGLASAVKVVIDVDPDDMM